MKRQRGIAKSTYAEISDPKNCKTEVTDFKVVQSGKATSAAVQRPQALHCRPMQNFSALAWLRT